MWFASSDHFRMSSFKTKIRRKKQALKQQLTTTNGGGGLNNGHHANCANSSVSDCSNKNLQNGGGGCTTSAADWEFVSFNPSMFGSRRNSIALSNPASSYVNESVCCADLESNLSLRDRCHSYGKDLHKLSLKKPVAPSQLSSCSSEVVKRRSKGDRTPNSRPSSWLSALPHLFFSEDEPDLGEKSSVFHNKSNSRVEPVKEAEERTCTTPISAVLQDAQYSSENENHFRQEITHNPGLKQHKSSGASINRSESYKERIHARRQIRDRRKTSDPNLPITNSDVETDTSVPPFSYATVNSGSSSNSNLSTRSLDSPSNSLEAVSNNSRNSCDNTISSNTSSNAATILTNNICSSINRTSAWDSDTEAEPDPPDWTRFVSDDELKQLSALEKKRQEVINELFHTERSHVRALKILDQLFYQPMKELQILPLDQIYLLFPNLEEMLDIHSQFNNNMKQRKKENPIVLEIGDILLKMFDGAEGETFQQAAATFCSRQQIALVLLKERRRKDPKLNNFLSDAEGNPICRRLQLKDIIPTGMLRLTKYPLLFENLAKYSRYNVEEERCVQRALERSKEILNHVNAAVKQAEDQHRLAEIQKRLDKSLFDKIDHPVTNEFKNLDVTKHKLVYEGSLNWRITNRQKLIDLHVLLLEDVIILLQRQDEKYVLKFYNTNSSAGERTPILSPVIKVSTALVRPNAADKKALYLVNTSHNGAQIYDLVASSTAEKKTWFRHISEAAEAYKTKDGKHRIRAADPSPVASHDFEDSSQQQQQHASKQKSDETKVDDGGVQDDNQNVTNNNAFGDADSPAKKFGGGGAGKSPNRPRKRGTEPPRLTTEENPLIEPSQVLICQRPVLTAEPVLTPLERLRRKDELIKNTLKEKHQLAAEILHVPRELYESTLVASNDDVIAADKEASELVLSLSNQGHQLIAIINEHLQVSEEEAIIATSEVHHSQQQQQQIQSKTAWSRVPSVPVPKLQSVANGINSHVTRLIGAITERDEERERLRQELQRSREQLHALHEVLQRIEQTGVSVLNNNNGSTSQTHSNAVDADITKQESSVNETNSSEYAVSSANVANRCTNSTTNNNNSNDNNNNNSNISNNQNTVVPCTTSTTTPTAIVSTSSAITGI